jgi:hypothetical protein
MISKIIEYEEVRDIDVDNHIEETDEELIDVDEIDDE